MRYLGVFLLMILHTTPMQGNNLVDSLKTVLQTATDSHRVDVLDDISWEFTFSNPDSAIHYGQQQLELAQTLRYRRGTGRAYGNLGRAHFIKGDFSNALELYDKGLHVRAMMGDRKGVATFLSNMAIIYRNQGNYKKALDNYLLALRVHDELKNKRGQGNTLNNLGVIYKELGDFKEALTNYQKALAIYEEIKFLRGQGDALNNIGNIHNFRKEYELALKTFEQSLLVQRKRKNTHGMADVYINMSQAHASLANFEQALAFADSAYTLYASISNKKGIAEVQQSMAKYYMTKYNFPRAVSYSREAYQTAHEIGAAAIEKEAAAVLAKAHQHMGDYKESLHYFNRFSQLKDSLQNMELRKQLSQMRHQYDMDLKNLEIASLEKGHQIDRIIQYAFFGGMVLFLFIAYLFYNRFQMKSKANQLLRAKNSEILLQKEEIEAQRDNIEWQNQQISTQKDELETQANLLAATNLKIEKAYSHIQDSIRYAKRIQQAIVGKQEHIVQHFKEAFILFLPKDVVSGDFYWFHQHTNKPHIKYLVCADCTGHGVPGAMMTAIGNTLLNKIIKVNEVDSPAEVLTQLDQQIQITLRQSDEQAQQDGMDMTIIKVDEEQQVVTCAGAKNPIVLVRDNEIRVIKGAKFSVGGVPIKRAKAFTETQIQLQADDTIYLYSDGFQDQFGGAKNSKYLSKRFRNLLLETNHLAIDAQKEILHQELENWKGEHEQTDDVLLMGLRF
ncbi:MAG: tetratricopeptide repeat protein [Flammeovirgaceae bacterium]